MAPLTVVTCVRFVLLLVSVEEGGIGVWLIEEEVKGVSELLTRFMRSYPLFEINEHGVEDVGDL